MLNIDEIEARMNAATPGPWETTGFLTVFVTDADPDNESGLGTYICQCHTNDTDVGLVEEEHNATFIAHARTDIPALCKELRATRVALTNIENYLKNGSDETTIRPRGELTMGEVLKAALINAFAAKLNSQTAGMQVYNNERENHGHSYGYGESAFHECCHNMQKHIAAILNDELTDQDVAEAFLS